MVSGLNMGHGAPPGAATRTCTSHKLRVVMGLILLHFDSSGVFRLLFS